MYAHKTWRAVALVAVGALIALGVSDALAGTSLTGNSITQVKVLNNVAADCPNVNGQYNHPCASGPDALTAVKWTTVPGVQTTVTVPAGTQAIILTRFSGSGLCSDFYPDTTCRFRTRIGSTSGAPAADSIVRPSEPLPPTGCLEANIPECYMERSTGPLGPGTYSIRVQYHQVGQASDAPYIGGYFQFWNLTIERIAL